MAGSIFSLLEDGTLIALSEQGYVNEDLLQDLLASHTELLAGEQMAPDSPRRWVLVAREFGVPGEEGTGSRWSLDHLFLDQDGVPTLVEVKRSSDTRIRREVVGQLLDYAANGIVYWPLETIRTAFENACDQGGTDPEVVIEDLVDVEIGYEDYWLRVRTNLQAGRIRLVFVADVIPPELRRIVEFLNEQMDPAEVLAVEVKQYVGEGAKALVPRVVGQTAVAQRTKGSRSGRNWDAESFFAELAKRGNPVESRIAREILDWAERNGYAVWWGEGAREGSFSPRVFVGGVKHQLFVVWTRGTVEIYFQHFKAPFDTEESRQAFATRLEVIHGVEFSESELARRPAFPLLLLEKEDALQTFLAAFEWYVEQLRS